MNVRVLTPDGDFQTINVIIQETLIFGLPLRRKDGTRYSPAKAALLSSEAADAAFIRTARQFKNQMSVARDMVQSVYIKNIRPFMTALDGTVSRTGSGSSEIITKEAEYDWFF